MPSFDNYIESQVTKMLYIGHTGAGKTGSTVALAAAGYNVRILDLDKGTELIADYVRNPKSIYRLPRAGLWTKEQADSVASRITYVPLDETISILKSPNAGMQPVPKGDLWGKVSDQLNEWKDVGVDGKEISLGNIGTWGPKDVLVVDGLSRLAQAAFNWQLKLGGRLTSRPEQSDYLNAQGAIERLLLMLYSSEVSCNVIMICHIAIAENESGIARGFPQTIGKALAPKIGQYFNHALMAKASGQGDKASRVILTNTSGIVELKSAAPLRVKSEYPIETGLAEYFRDIRGKGDSK